jgi:hypothetical protein
MNFGYFRKKQGKKAYKKVVFIAGSGRSGTTWLAELINFREDYRVLFEPFHHTYVPEWSGYTNRQYLRGNETDAGLSRSMAAILTGNINNKWVDKRPVPPGVDKLLIKDIRANLLLKWIKGNYPHIPVILLVRHPGAVIHSKLKLDWEVDLEGIIRQENLEADFLHRFMDYLENPDLSVFQKHALMWCIENYVPLRQFTRDGIHIVFYEDLILKPEITLKAVFNFIDENYDDSLLNRLGIPSLMTRSHSAILAKNKDLLRNWEKGIGEDETRILRECLQVFGLDTLYNSDGLPQPENLYKIV